MNINQGDEKQVLLVMILIRVYAMFKLIFTDAISVCH